MKIQLPEPCSEKLQPLKDGKSWCTSCAHNVVDFSNFSDAALRDVLSSKSEKACGIFSDDQLGRKLTRGLFRQRFVRRFTLSIVLIFGTTLFSFGNTPFVNEWLPVAQSVATKLVSNGDTEPVYFTYKGKVTTGDYWDRTPLKNATIEFVAGDYIVSGKTDANGEFALQIDKKQLEGIEEGTLTAKKGRKKDVETIALDATLHEPMSLFIAKKRHGKKNYRVVGRFY